MLVLMSAEVLLTPAKNAKNNKGGDGTMRIIVSSLGIPNSSNYLFATDCIFSFERIGYGG